MIVIAGSVATKQSISPWYYFRVASLSLSSGAHSRDPLARNDGERWSDPLHPPTSGIAYGHVCDRGSQSARAGLVRNVARRHLRGLREARRRGAGVALSRTRGAVHAHGLGPHRP